MLRLLLLAATGCGLYFDDEAVQYESPSMTLECTPIVQPDQSPAPAASCPSSTLGHDRWVAFDADIDLFNRDLYLMRADGSERCRLTTATSIDMEPAPSPDGTQIAFASNRSGSFQIHLLDLATSGVRQLTTAGGEEPAFSHDGTRIAYRSGTAIHVIRTDGTDDDTIADSGLDLLNAYANPVFSPDDSELYFDRNNEIHGYRLDGSGGLRYVVNNWTIRIQAPAVVSNGLAIAYQTQCGTGLEVEGDSIWITESQIANDPCVGRRATPADDVHQAQRPALGVDDVIAFEYEDWASGIAGIALVDTEPSSAICPLTTDPYDHRNPAWLIRP
jgi:dipeptidyl aminopeptidase/acylaminoacyl peptidase